VPAQKERVETRALLDVSWYLLVYFIKNEQENLLKIFKFLLISIIF